MVGVRGFGLLPLPPEGNLARLTHHCDILEAGNESWCFKSRTYGRQQFVGSPMRLTG